MKNRLQYNYYFNGKKYTRKTLSLLVGSDSFFKHIKDFEYHPSRYSNIQKTSYGYDYTFTGGEYAGETVNIHIKKITKQKINLDSKFYALDLETSTFYNQKDVDWQYRIHNGTREIERISADEPVSVPYLCGIREYDIHKMYESSVSGGYIKYMFSEKHFEGYQGLRTYDDVINWIVKLCTDAEQEHTVKFIVIQNNAYEQSFLHSNVYTKLPEGFKYIPSYIRPHKPMKIDIFKNDELCIRILDTYLLTGQSINSYGETYGYEKLEKADNYNSTFTPVSVLPQDEYIYNKRDLDISALMFINVIKDLTNSCNKTMEEVLPRLFTKTGVTRLKNRWLFENEKDNLYYNRIDMMKDNLNADIECFIDSEGNIGKRKLFEFNHDCFIGGFVRANENTVYKIQKEVKSIDITSSYPYSMVSKVYGFQYKSVTDFDALSFIKEWKESAELLIQNQKKFLFLYFNNFLMFRLSKQKPFWNASIIISDIQPKPLINQNSMLIMSTSKLIDSQDALVNNGRIVTCKKAVLNVSCVELLNYIMIYDFKIDAVSYFEYAEKTGKLPKSQQKTVQYYYKRKSDLKPLVQAQKDGCLVLKMESIKDLSLNEFEQNYIRQHEYDKDISVYLEQLLMNAKADLNAQYGINVEKPNHDEIICSDNNEFSIVSNEVEQSIFRRNFKVGMLITAWSRMHLILMSLMLINAGAVIHYWDTDSIKFTADDTIDETVKLFNKKIGHFKNCDGIGTFTFEYQKGKNYSYEEFISGGSKNYWYVLKNEVHFTVSGLSGKSFEIVNDYYHKDCKNDFRQFVIECLQPMTVFDGESIGTNLTDYTHQNKEIECDINGYHFKGYSGVIINQPQSRAILPYPSRFIESRFFKEYGKRCKPQLLLWDSGKSVILEINDLNAKEVIDLR